MAVTLRRRNRINVVAAISKLSLLPVWPDETTSRPLDSWLMTMSSAELRPLCTKRQTRMSGQMRSIRVASCRAASATSARLGSVRFGFGSTRLGCYYQHRLLPLLLNWTLSIVEHLGEVCEWNSGRAARAVARAVARVALHEWKLPRVYQTHAMCHCNGCQFALSFACRHIYIHGHTYGTYIDISCSHCVPSSCPYITVSPWRLLQFDLIWFPFFFASLSFCQAKFALPDPAMGYTKLL